MTPHHQVLLLLFTLSQCASLSLNRNEQAHFLPSTDPEPGDSSSWTTKTDPSLSPDALHPSRDLLTEPNLYVTTASKTPWIETLVSSKTELPSDIQNDEEGTQTEQSDWRNFRKPFPSPSQTWSSESKYRNTFKSQTAAETRLSTHRVLWKSFSATQTPYARGSLDGTASPKEPYEETKDLTDAPTGNQIKATSEPTQAFHDRTGERVNVQKTQLKYVPFCLTYDKFTLQ